MEQTTFIRVCELEKGDKFLWNGCWRIVTKKDERKVHYKTLHETSVQKETLGAKSKQFVETVKQKTNDQERTN